MAILSPIVHYLIPTTFIVWRKDTPNRVSIFQDCLFLFNQGKFYKFIEWRLDCPFYDILLHLLDF